MSATALLPALQGAHAQSAFPSKPITIVCPYAAGATTDTISRIFAQALGGELNVNVIVENKAGAGGNIGSAAVARAAPDGHTILLGAMGPMAINGALYASLGFDPLKDLAPIGLMAAVPLALVVNANSPHKTLGDLVQSIKQMPNGMNYASAGAGTPMHLAGELFGQAAGLKLVHTAYRGSAPAINDVVGGHVPFMFDALVNVLPQIQGGTLRALATTSEKARPALLPGVPTLAEAGYPVAVAGWYGFLVPAATPEPERNRLSEALARIVARDEVAKKLAALGSDPVDPRPAAFKALIASETERWQPLVKRLGLKAE
ncbi:MAG: Bug family tripartite tricarboxylate transporter substrate binding protein [Beijerinckiaceae bacterium]